MFVIQMGISNMGYWENTVGMWKQIIKDLNNLLYHPSMELEKINKTNMATYLSLSGILSYIGEEAILLYSQIYMYNSVI